MFGIGKPADPTRTSALPGRDQPLFEVPELHEVLGTPLTGPWPDGYQSIFLAMGCFWGAEKLFWNAPGVYSTSVGYMGGGTPHPTYTETCTGLTGHTETVQVVFDPKLVGLTELMRMFWENHDPTQKDRQGNDVGSQYRSAVFTRGKDQESTVRRTAAAFQQELTAAGFGRIVTELVSNARFYYAEEYHQQYLEKNPGGYCPAHGTGVTCPSPPR